MAADRHVVLVLGGARSGKSRFAEEMAGRAARPVTYLATAQAGDEEMRRRIALHRSRRSAEWTTLETPLDLAGALRARSGSGGTLLVDCLTLWLSNLMAAARDVDAEIDALADALEGHHGMLICVSNEVGLGIVPENALARAFRDHAGRLNQRVAQAATEVYFLAAGLPLRLKPQEPRP